MDMLVHAADHLAVFVQATRVVEMRIKAAHRVAFQGIRLKLERVHRNKYDKRAQKRDKAPELTLSDAFLCRRLEGLFRGKALLIPVFLLHKPTSF